MQSLIILDLWLMFFIKTILKILEVENILFFSLINIITNFNFCVNVIFIKYFIILMFLL